MGHFFKKRNLLLLIWFDALETQKIKASRLALVTPIDSSLLIQLLIWGIFSNIPNFIAFIGGFESGHPLNACVLMEGLSTTISILRL